MRDARRNYSFYIGGVSGWSSEQKHIDSAEKIFTKKDKKNPDNLMDYYKLATEQYLYTEYNDGPTFYYTPKHKNDIFSNRQDTAIFPTENFVRKFVPVDKNHGIVGFKLENVSVPIKYTQNEITTRLNNVHEYHIDKNTRHLTNFFFNHGDEQRRFKGSSPLYKGRLLETHFKRLKTEELQKLKSFYFKCEACHGAYHDGKTTIFNEIQNKLMEMKPGEKPKCFVRLLKKEYSGFLDRETNLTTERENFKSLPLKNDEFIDLDDVYDHPDNYFDYYYVTECEIYKVPHDFVHRRIELTENSALNKEVEDMIDHCFFLDNIHPCMLEKFKQSNNFYEKFLNNKEIRKIDVKQEFPEFYQTIHNQIPANNSIDSRVSNANWPSNGFNP